MVQKHHSRKKSIEAQKKRSNVLVVCYCSNPVYLQADNLEICWKNLKLFYSLLHLYVI